MEFQDFLSNNQDSLLLTDSSKENSLAKVSFGEDRPLLMSKKSLDALSFAESFDSKPCVSNYVAFGDRDSSSGDEISNAKEEDWGLGLLELERGKVRNLNLQLERREKEIINWVRSHGDLLKEMKVKDQEIDRLNGLLEDLKENNARTAVEKDKFSRKSIKDLEGKYRAVKEKYRKSKKNNTQLRTKGKTEASRSFAREWGSGEVEELKIQNRSFKAEIENLKKRVTDRKRHNDAASQNLNKSRTQSVKPSKRAAYSEAHIRKIIGGLLTLLKVRNPDDIIKTLQGVIALSKEVHIYQLFLKKLDKLTSADSKDETGYMKGIYLKIQMTIKELLVYRKKERYNEKTQKALKFVMTVLKVSSPDELPLALARVID